MQTIFETFNHWQVFNNKLFFFQQVKTAVTIYKKEGLTKEQNNDLDLIRFENKS